MNNVCVFVQLGVAYACLHVCKFVSCIMCMLMSVSLFIYVFMCLHVCFVYVCVMHACEEECVFLCFSVYMSMCGCL